MFRLIDSDNYSLDDYARSKSDNRFKVLGKGAVSVKPDVAEVMIGVVKENPQLEVAQEENASVTQQVINSIIRMGVLPKYIQTENYNIRSNYDYIEGKQVFRGYEVSNNIKVLIRNIDLAGEIIDAAVKNGANNVSGINFIVSDQSTYYYEALRLAITDAQNKASVMADKLKVKLDVTPIQIFEQEMGGIAPLGSMTLKNVSVTTPIQAGENKIIADIEAVFKYSEL
jgi:uncharacterized protein